MAKTKFTRDGVEYTLLDGVDADAALERTYPYYDPDPDLGGRWPAECPCGTMTMGRYYTAEGKRAPLCQKCADTLEQIKNKPVEEKKGVPCPDCGGDCDSILEGLKQAFAIG